MLAEAAKPRYRVVEVDPAADKRWDAFVLREGTI
jgi:hypothetical protein